MFAAGDLQVRPYQSNCKNLKKSKEGESEREARDDSLREVGEKTNTHRIDLLPHTSRQNVFPSVAQP